MSGKGYCRFLTFDRLSLDSHQINYEDIGPKEINGILKLLASSSGGWRKEKNIRKMIRNTVDVLYKGGLSRESKLKAFEDLKVKYGLDGISANLVVYRTNEWMEVREVK